MGQTWYLAVEMQCFIITPLLIWPLWKFPKFGLGLVSSFIVVGTKNFNSVKFYQICILLVTGVAIGLAWDNDYPPTAALMGSSSTYMEDYYVVPWIRIQPYLMGMILGFILYKLRTTEKLKLNSIALTWCWVKEMIM